MSSSRPGEPAPGELLIFQQYHKVSYCRFLAAIIRSDSVKDVIYLLYDLLTTLAKLTQPGGARAVIAENLLLKQQLIVHSESPRVFRRLVCLSQATMADSFSWR
jgi:hypothetical protein